MECWRVARGGMYTRLDLVSRVSCAAARPPHASRERNDRARLLELRVREATRGLSRRVRPPVIMGGRVVQTMRRSCRPDGWVDDLASISNELDVEEDDQPETARTVAPNSAHTALTDRFLDRYFRCAIITLHAASWRARNGAPRMNRAESVRRRRPFGADP
eukprot:scaffold120339_cov33-Phaeocystis_antarctica.AAC.2